MEGLFKSALVVSKDIQVVETIKKCSYSDFRFYNAPNKSGALEKLRDERYDLVFIDLKILIENVPKDSYEKALKPFKHMYPSMHIVVMSSGAEVQHAVKAVNAGASNYLMYPINSEEVKLLFDKISASVIQQSELDYLRDKFWRADSLDFTMGSEKTCFTG